MSITHELAFEENVEAHLLGNGWHEHQSRRLPSFRRASPAEHGLQQLRLTTAARIGCQSAGEQIRFHSPTRLTALSGIGRMRANRN